MRGIFKVKMPELNLELQDTQWPKTYIDHDRQIVRAIVVDDEQNFYFVKVQRDDDFGKGTFIETSGGGVEAGEDLTTALKRELKEELGANVDILCKIGVVSDYYNLIHRHNINNYFLCKLTYDEAVDAYEKQTNAKLGQLITNRELPILKQAEKLISNYK